MSIPPTWLVEFHQNQAYLSPTCNQKTIKTSQTVPCGILFNYLCHKLPPMWMPLLIHMSQIFFLHFSWHIASKYLREIQAAYKKAIAIIPERNSTISTTHVSYAKCHDEKTQSVLYLKKKVHGQTGKLLFERVVKQYVNLLSHKRSISYITIHFNAMIQRKELQALRKKKRVRGHLPILASPNFEHSQHHL